MKPPQVGALPSCIIKRAPSSTTMTDLSFMQKFPPPNPGIYAFPSPATLPDNLISVVCPLTVTFDASTRIPPPEEVKLIVLLYTEKVEPEFTVNTLAERIAIPAPKALTVLYATETELSFDTRSIAP